MPYLVKLTDNNTGNQELLISNDGINRFFFRLSENEPYTRIRQSSSRIDYYNHKYEGWLDGALSEKTHIRNHPSRKGELSDKSERL